MKKLLSLILALAMVLALVACGNKTTDDSNAAGNGDTTDADPIRIGFLPLFLPPLPPLTARAPSSPPNLRSS